MEYHEEMNYQKFRDWFMVLLDNLQPMQSNRKSDLVRLLSHIGILVDTNMLKGELIGLVRRHA